MKRNLAVGIIAFLFVYSTCSAAGKGISFSGDTSFLSKYVWRGFVLDTDKVMQTGLYASSALSESGTLKLSVWSNAVMDNKDEYASNEFDYVMDYSFSFENLSLSIGNTFYDFTGLDLKSRECYFGITLTEISADPSLYVYRDYGDEEDGGGDGYYIVLNSAYSIPVEKMSVDLSGHVGWNKDLFMEGKGGDFFVAAGLNMPLTDNLFFKPNMNYSLPFGDLEDENIGAQESEFFGGMTLTYSL